MFGHVGTLHRQEGTCPDMEADIAPLDPAAGYPVKDGFREMEACRRGGNRTADPGIERLVPLGVKRF